MNVINQIIEALDKYRSEVFSSIDRYGGIFCFTSNMDFMKVTDKLILGYLQNRFAHRKIRKWQVSAESLKIAEETGASFQEVKELFLLLMNPYIQP